MITILINRKFLRNINKLNKRSLIKKLKLDQKRLNNGQKKNIMKNLGSKNK